MYRPCHFFRRTCGRPHPTPPSSPPRSLVVGDRRRTLTKISSRAPRPRPRRPCLTPLAVPDLQAVPDGGEHKGKLRTNKENYVFFIEVFLCFSLVFLWFVFVCLKIFLAFLGFSLFSLWIFLFFLGFHWLFTRRISNNTFQISLEAAKVIPFGDFLCSHPRFAVT